MRGQDQSPEAGKHGTAGARGSRSRRGAQVQATGPAPAIAMNHAVASRSPQAVLALQRAAGNAAVAQLAEQEQHVHDEGCAHQQGRQHSVQRSGIDQVLRSPGTPIAGPVRRDMEARLGADFSDVRLHNDASARRSAAELGARAFTSGSHVVIGAGGADSRTLAHELIHVVQQRRGPVAGTDNGSGLKVSDPSDRFEREAEAGAARAMSAPAPVRTEGGPAAAVQRAGTVVQRAPNTTAPTLCPEELALTQRGDRRALGMGKGYRYSAASISEAVEPLPLYRAMKKQEFDALRAGALPQGGSFQGFSPERGYSETYVTGNDAKSTHLVEFYRPSQVGPSGEPIQDLKSLIMGQGVLEKSERRVLSVGVGLAAKYDPKTLANTSANVEREVAIRNATERLAVAKHKSVNATVPKVRKTNEKNVPILEADLAALKAKKPARPAKGDALKVLNRDLASGKYAWRLVTFKTTV